MTVNFDHYVIKFKSKEIRGTDYDWYKFRIFVNEPNNILQNIDYVEYQLHPTFPAPNRRVSGERRLSKFYLEFEGFAGFDMNIIVRLKDGHDEDYSYTISLDKQWPLEELEGVDLAFAKLEGVNLERANLKGAKLVRAELNKASLKNAELSGANLNRAKLMFSNLENSKLVGADLVEANLLGANLKNAKLNNADLYGIKLISANLEGADFTEAKIKDAEPEKVKFSESTDFRGADINSTTIYHLKESNWWDAKWDPWVREEIEKKYKKK